MNLLRLSYENENDDEKGMGYLVIELTRHYIPKHPSRQDQSATTTQTANFECTRAELDEALRALGYSRSDSATIPYDRAEDREGGLRYIAMGGRSAGKPLSQIQAMAIREGKLREASYGLEAGTKLKLKWVTSRLDAPEGQGGKLTHLFDAKAPDGQDFMLKDVDLTNLKP